MLPTTFGRLAVDKEIRADAPTPTAGVIPPRLLRLAARRMREGVAPPRCYYWYGGKPPVRLDGRAI